MVAKVALGLRNVMATAPVVFSFEPRYERGVASTAESFRDVVAAAESELFDQ
jgi:hypothetical protein